MKHYFFYAPKSVMERIEEELRPLESAFLTMLNHKALKPETQKKIEQNLEAFSHFRKRNHQLSSSPPRFCKAL